MKGFEAAWGKLIDLVQFPQMVLYAETILASVTNFLPQGLNPTAQDLSTLKLRQTAFNTFNANLETDNVNTSSAIRLLLERVTPVVKQQHLTPRLNEVVLIGRYKLILQKVLKNNSINSHHVNSQYSSTPL